MARREGGGGGPMGMLVGAFIGLIVIVAVVILAPTIMGSIEQAQPAMPATSDWNSTHNAELPNGAAIWTDNVTFGAIVILIFFASMAIFYIRAIA
jgi:hypothetical protein